MSDTQKLQRHAGIDRLFHWSMAATMAVLLATSLLPILGIRFAWYGIHWVAGLLLTLLILLHIVRALFWQRPGTMLVITAADFTPRGAGKYTLPQKLMHLGWAVAVLVAIVTGLLLLPKAGVSFMTRASATSLSPLPPPMKEAERSMVTTPVESGCRVRAAVHSATSSSDRITPPCAVPRLLVKCLGRDIDSRAVPSPSASVTMPRCATNGMRLWYSRVKSSFACALI